jgi:hypothetical protein
MTCQHENILTLRFVDNNDVAMWACAKCRMRFEPASALDKSFRDGAKHEREACAKVCDEVLNQDGNWSPTGHRFAKAIRARDKT